MHSMARLLAGSPVPRSKPTLKQTLTYCKLAAAGPQATDLDTASQFKLAESGDHFWPHDPVVLRLDIIVAFAGVHPDELNIDNV